jgi:hypothetical protein
MSTGPGGQCSILKRLMPRQSPITPPQSVPKATATTPRPIRKPKTTVERLRDYRERKRNGVSVYRVVLNEVDLEELLIAARTLTQEDCDNLDKRQAHMAVESALTKFIELLISDHHNG